MMRRSAFLLAVLATAAAGAVVAAGSSAPKPLRLQPFGSCAELVAYAKQNAAKVVDPSGTLRPGVVAGPVAGTERTAGADSSATNVQEQGVDEPDIVKSDGSVIFAVAGGRLEAVDARARRPRLVGSLPLEQGSSHELLAESGKVLVLSRTAFAEPLPFGPRRIAPIGLAKTVLTAIDVHDPAAMRVVQTLTVDGEYVTARLVGRTARVVVALTPLLRPVERGTPKQGAIASTRLREWLPSMELWNRRTGRKTTSALVQCRAVLRPPVFSGGGMVTVLTIDLDRGLRPVDSDAVLTDGRTVYASKDALYVASQRWLPVPLARDGSPPEGMTTELHKFDISKPDRTSYLASGSVQGFLLNQWSLSEDRGYLRVASTDLPVWWNASPARESESFVSSFAERDGNLVEVGRVGGLGRGQRVYAVRFLGDVGYVVTFRQIDPLYTIDLARPERPRVLGELELRGYSAYLHPVGKDRLLGVGQDATEEGRLAGTQLSLFDISDLRKPVRSDAVTLGPGSSEVEYDHHAFLFWPPKSLAVMPMDISAAPTPFVGAIAFRIASNGLQERGRIAHPGTGAATPVRRAVVVGDRLFTVSERGVKASSLETLEDLGWVPFP